MTGHARTSPGRALLLCAAALATGAGVSACRAQEQALTSPQARRHVEAARAVAGSDLAAEMETLCRKPRPSRVLGQPLPEGQRPAPRPPAPPEVGFEPTRVFDNMYYFGSPKVGATVIATSEGLVLIDTLTLSEDVERILLPGMRRMGLDPARIKVIVLTHAHGDHHGGVRYLRDRFPGFQVVMSARDWEYSEKPYFMADGSPDPAPKPPRAPQDIAYTGSHELTLGEMRMKILETPGHTPGTSSLVYTIVHQGQPHAVMHWGGGTPMGTEYELATVERFIAEARAANVSVRWSSHTDERSREKLAQVRANPSAPNPFIEGSEKLGRYLSIVEACKRAVTAQ